MWRPIAVSACMTVLLSPAAHGQRVGGARLTGVVVDTAGVPVAFANIILPDARRVIGTADGRFVVSVEESSERSIEIRRIGFEPRTVSFDAWPDTVVRISIVPIPLRLERIRVEAERRIQSLVHHGFYQRQAEAERGINHGFFITPEELEKRSGGRTTDFLYNHPGVKVNRVKEPSKRGRTGLQPQGSDGCRLEIYIDGVRFYAINGLGLQTGGINFIDDMVPVSNIAAIEVYPRAVGAPPKYQSLNGACGVMLIWTK